MDSFTFKHGYIICHCGWFMLPVTPESKDGDLQCKQCLCILQGDGTKVPYHLCLRGTRICRQEAQNELSESR